MSPRQQRLARPPSLINQDPPRAEAPGEAAALSDLAATRRDERLDERARGRGAALSDGAPSLAQQPARRGA